MYLYIYIYIYLHIFYAPLKLYIHNMIHICLFSPFFCNCQMTSAKSARARWSVPWMQRCQIATSTAWWMTGHSDADVAGLNFLCMCLYSHIYIYMLYIKYCNCIYVWNTYKHIYIYMHMYVYIYIYIHMYLYIWLFIYIPYLIGMMTHCTVYILHMYITFIYIWALLFQTWSLRPVFSCVAKHADKHKCATIPNEPLVLTLW